MATTRDHYKAIMVICTLWLLMSRLLHWYSKEPGLQATRPVPLSLYQM